MNPLQPNAIAPESEQTLSAALRAYGEFFYKRLWILIAVVAIGTTCSVLYTLHKTKIYEATTTIVVNPQAPRVNKEDDVIQLGAGTYLQDREYYTTQIEILSAYPLAHTTVMQNDHGEPLYDRIVPRAEEPTLTNDKRASLAAERLVKMLGVSQHRESRIIAISVRNADPELAKLLANTHSASYVSFIRSKRTVGTGQASLVLSAQIDEAQKQLRAAEAEITKFKTEHALITRSFDDKQNTVVSELQRYSAALADAKVKRIELSALRNRALALKDDEVFESPIFALVSNSAVIDQLKSSYVQAKQKFIEVGATYGPKSEEHQAAKKKVDDLYAQIQAEAKRAMREIEERYQTAVAAESGYESLVSNRSKDAEALDKLYAEYAPLVRDQKYADEEYTKLVARLASSRQEGQNDMINVEPHDAAREADLVAPRMRVNVAIAAIVSLLLGVMLVFLLNYFDRTIKSIDGIAQLVGAPLLGIIPVVDHVPASDTASELNERDLYVFKNPTSQPAECCRSIRTNIMFSAADRPMKTITVSSARPREGKTTTTIYLGTIMAQSGQRVLLIDTDLRRPRLHKPLNVSRTTGLTTLLVGESTYEEAIKPTAIPNLFVLPCGPLPPNPVELLLTNRFKEVLAELENRFDRILLDSPPVLAVTDAVVLSHISDGVILVAQAGKSQIPDVIASARQFRDIEAPVLGMILNEIDISDRRYGGYYYAYGGYGEDKVPEKKGSEKKAPEKKAPAEAGGTKT